MLTLHLERAHWPKLVCGVDEAGRGPWAGPVVAASVVFLEIPPPLGGRLGGGRSDADTEQLTAPPQPSPYRGGGSLLAGLNDSKKLSAAKREELFSAIRAMAAVGVGVASAEEIEQLNIWGATVLAMRRAMGELAAVVGAMPDMALVDGKTRPRDFPCATQMVIGGDGISPSIAAASIIAKVTRDRMMRELAQMYPQYGFERHAGYGTKQHQAALEAHGVCPAHRRGFAPIRALIAEAA